RTAPAHIDDIAEATARVLATGEHRGNLYTLTAADTIDWTDLARLASTVSGTPVEYQPVTDDQFTAAATAQGIPAALVGLPLGGYHAFRAGWTGPPTGDLATILGRAPRPALDAVSAAVSS